MSNQSPAEIARKIERWETGQKYLSVLTAIGSFWIIALSWNYYNFGFGALEAVPRLGLAAALSWVVFLHAEAIGMLIMTMMKEKWQSEAREAQYREQEAEFRERELALRERELEIMAQDREDRVQDRKDRAQDREDRAREAELTREIILGLMRRLEAVEGGENANGGKA